MLHAGSLSSKHGWHKPAGSSGPQNTSGLRFLTLQQSSSSGLVHCRKSSSQTAGGSARKLDSGRLRSASRMLARLSSWQVEKRPQTCFCAGWAARSPRRTK